jgi:hypothetical protein
MTDVQTAATSTTILLKRQQRFERNLAKIRFSTTFTLQLPMDRVFLCFKIRTVAQIKLKSWPKPKAQLIHLILIMLRLQI